MTPYWLIFLALALLCFVSAAREFRRARLLLYVIASGGLALFAGLRAPGVGADDGNYIRVFEALPSLQEWLTDPSSLERVSTHMEIGYLFLNVLVKGFSDSHVILFLVLALLSVGISTYNYWRYSPYVFLTLLAYFAHTYFAYEFSVVRTGLAASIGLFLIRFIDERAHAKVIATILLAMSFHIAAAAYFLAYAVSFVKITRDRVIGVVAVSLMLGVIEIGGLLLHLPEGYELTDPIHRYAKSLYAEPLGVLNLVNIKNLVIVGFMLLLWPRLKERVLHFEVMAMFMMLATAWRLAFSDFGIIAGRVATFFSIVEVVLVAAFVVAFRERVFAILAVVLYAAATLFLKLHYEGFSPYVFVSLGG